MAIWSVCIEYSCPFSSCFSSSLLLLAVRLVDLPDLPLVEAIGTPDHATQNSVFSPSLAYFLCTLTTLSLSTCFFSCYSSTSSYFLYPSVSMQNHFKIFFLDFFFPNVNVPWKSVLRSWPLLFIVFLWWQFMGISVAACSKHPPADLAPIPFLSNKYSFVHTCARVDLLPRHSDLEVSRKLKLHLSEGGTHFSTCFISPLFQACNCCTPPFYFHVHFHH